jgi:hypothetical protein
MRGFSPPSTPRLTPKTALVRIEERRRREQEPRHTRQGSEYTAKITLFSVRGRRDPEHSETSGGSEQAVTLLERLTANCVEDQFNASAVCYFSCARLKVFMLVVNQMFKTEGFQSIMLRSRSCADKPCRRCSLRFALPLCRRRPRPNERASSRRVLNRP